MNTANKNFTETVNASELLSQFNILFNKLYHKKNVSLIEQKAGLLKAYKNWVYLNKFQIEFSVSLIGFCELVFGGTLVNSKIPDWAIKKLLNSHTLKEIFTLTEGKQENWKRVLEKSYSNNKSASVSQSNIEQVFEKDISSKKQSFAKFEHRLTNIKKGNFEKKDLDDFLKTIEKLQVRVVGDVEQYKFKLDVFKNNPDDSYEILKTLRNIMLAWYDKRYGELTEDEFESTVYDRFETDILAEFLDGNLKSNKALAASLDAVFYYLETELDTPFQLTRLNENFFSTLKRSSKDEVSKYSRLNSHVLIQHWAEKVDRLESNVLPTLIHYCFSKGALEESRKFNDELKLKSQKLFDFLNQPLIDCLIRIQHFIYESSSDDELLSQIIDELNINLFEVKELIEQEYLRTESKLKQSTGLSVSELYSLSSCNSSLSSAFIFKALVLIHSLILKNNLEYSNHTDLVKDAFKCEESNLLKGIFLHFSFYRTLGIDIHQVITNGYLEFKKEIFNLSKALVLLCFCRKRPKSDMREFINDKLSVIFKKRLPISNKSLLEGEYNKEVKDILGVLSISLEEAKDFPFSAVLQAGFNDYEQEKYFESCDPNLLTELVYILKNEKLIEKAWLGIVGDNDKDIIFYSFIAHFLHTDSLGVTEFVGQDRNKIKNNFKGKYFQDYLKSVTSKDFDEVTLDFNESLNSALDSKLEVVSNIINLGDERFRLVYDASNNPIQLGRGGFGSVYKAEDTVLSSIVAIKLLPKWHDSIYLEKKLLREAVLMRKCHHENILTLFDVHAFKTDKLAIASNIASKKIASFKHDRTIYGLITEYPKTSKTLSEFNVDELSFEDKCQILIQLSGAVAEIHFNGLVHGDIKPENILCDDNLKIKLLDFGSATDVKNTHWSKTESLFLSDGIKLGRPVEKIDDLYSIGIIALYLIDKELFAFLNERFSDVENGAYIAIHAFYNNWTIGGSLGEQMGYEKIDYFEKLKLALKESGFSSILSELSKFNPLKQNNKNYALLHIILELVAPYVKVQIELSEMLADVAGLTPESSSYTNYKKIESAKYAQKAFEKLSSGTSFYEPIQGVLFYGELLTKKMLNSIPVQDLSNIVDFDVSRENQIFTNDYVSNELSRDFLCLLETIEGNEGALIRLKNNCPWEFNFLIQDYESMNNSELEDNVNLNTEQEDRLNLHGENIGNSYFWYKYKRVKIDFSSIKREVKLYQEFYKTNSNLLAALGWLSEEELKRPSSSVTGARFRKETKNPKVSSYQSIISLYGRVFLNNQKDLTEIKSLGDSRLKTYVEESPDSCSVFSSVFYNYKIKVEKLIDAFIGDFGETAFLEKIPLELFDVLSKKFRSTETLNEYLDEFPKLPKELGEYLWNTLSTGSTQVDNQLLSGLNKGLKVSKYDLFRLEIISYPAGKFSLRLKQIHEELFTPVNFEKLLTDLKIIWSWRFNSTHYAAYKILQSLPEKDIA
ncbi:MULTISPECIES: protein kinase [unclassified Pseudoalteromonas]|uniref:protein kinase domain-containing protein n=1 Tax=unclassified Pseudoalteromonas TaxID=194690 RepID=UPI001486DC4B|nr:MULTISPECIES: protein kinase [unclassified Pseudoalteromonas]MDN3403272.1 protein kinase [Pseudoalteromonas sp. APC 3213]